MPVGYLESDKLTQVARSMADNSNQYSSQTTSSGSSASGSTKALSSSSNTVPQSVEQYLLSETDCETLFQAEPISSLDLYLLDRCSGDSLLKIPSEAMSDTGVTFNYNFEGDILTSASPSNDYYRMTNATVDISFTIRWHQVADSIKTLIFPGTAESAGDDKTKHTINRRIIRRRPKSFILLAVAEGESPDPASAADGALLFPNVSLDFGNGISLNYNPNDPLELETQLTARFTRGVDGVLAVMWY